ncbi:hypothetical protein LP415_12870 [Polaromonas sp. P1(28)-8]|nr:hypothetical protein LP415_12870 [Polaromonas sp. P1(28)-8]
MKNYWLDERVNKKLKILTERFSQIQNELFIFARSGYWLVPISWGLVIVYISPRFGSAYSPDSFAYYLIGVNFISGWGYASQAIRDFYLQVTPEFFQSSRSFPPLMPILVGIVEVLFKKGITSGLLVNIFVLLTMFHAHFLLSRKIAGKYFWVAFLALSFFIVNNDSGDSFVAEIVSGRSIPLAALIYTLILLTILNRKLTIRRSFFLGTLLGMLYLTRFDSLIFCLLLIGYIALEKITNMRWVVYGLLASILPWLFRNAIVFGNPFASDNSITAFSTYPSIVQISWFDNIPLLRDNPNLWATQRLSYVIENTKFVIGLLNPIGGFVTMALSAFGLLSPNIPKNIKTYIVIAWLWLFSNLMTVSLTPYHDARYFSLSVFVIGLSALLTVATLLLDRFGINIKQNDDATIDNTTTQKYQQIVVVISLILSVGVVNYFVKSEIKSGDLNASAYQCLYDGFKDDVNKSDLVAYYAAEHLAYYSKWRTIYTPLNLSEPDKQFISWKKKLNVRYAIVPDGSSIAKHPKVIIKKKACGALLVDLAEL